MFQWTIYQKDSKVGTTIKNPYKSAVPKKIEPTIDTLQQHLTDKELQQQVQEAILRNEVETIDTLLLCRWVNSKATSINTTYQSIQYIQRDTIATINKTTSNIDSQSATLLQDITKTVGIAQNKAIESKDICIGEIRKAKNDIMSAQQAGIATLNRCSNMHKDILDKTVNNAKYLFESLKASNIVAKTSQTELNRVIKKIESELEDAYDTYEEKINETTELEKKEFREWMDNNKTYIDLNNERERIKAERMLLEQDRKQFQKWFESVKAQIPSPTPTFNNKIHHSSTTTTNLQKAPTSTPQFNEYNNSIPNHTSSTQLPNPQRDKYGEAPYDFDTVIRYKNQIYDCIGYITNNESNKPYMMTSTWFYNISTIHGIDINDCNGDHITIFGDTMHQNLFDADSNSNAYNANHHSSSNSSPNHRTPPQRRITANQFQYPIGNDPASVNHYGLSKQGEKWADLKLSSDEESQQFYNILQGRLATFHIYLLEYDQINSTSGLFAIIPYN